MNFAFYVFQKELLSLIRDKRAIAMNFILPACIFPVFILLMALVPLTQKNEAMNAHFRITIVNNTDQRLASKLAESFPITNNQKTDQISVRILFPDGFPQTIKEKIYIEYSSEDARQVYAAEKIRPLVEQYVEDTIAEQQRAAGINPDEWRPEEVVLVDQAPDVFQKNAKAAAVIPYIVICLLMLSGLGIGLDTTVGEKERGGLLLLLSNSIPRTSIALGKIFFVMFCSITNGICSCVGLIIAVLFSSATGSFITFTGALDPFLLCIGLLLIFITGALFASIIVLVGSASRTMKEANGFMMPFNLFVLLLSTIGTQLDARANHILQWVPILNFFVSLKDILVGKASEGSWLITCSVNFLITGIIVFLLTRLYQSERILR